MERSQSNDPSRLHQTRRLILKKKFQTIQAGEVTAETKSLGSYKSANTIGVEGAAFLKQGYEATRAK